MSVRVRIAPSPTGDPHVGTAYMALFNLMYARRFGGQFILRIEDTDQSRSRPEYEQAIFDALKWCGLSWDEGPDVGGPYGPYRQSERTDIYRGYAEQLLDAGKAYRCFCTPQDLAEMREISAKSGQRQGYDRRCRGLSDDEIAERLEKGLPYTIRLKVPLTGECIYHDAVKGRISSPWADVDDQVLLKSDGFPTYHLANVVDDHLMKITHVIRGDEWMSSTPKHVYLYEAFGWTAPTFLHLPLLLGKDGRKLSKRRNPTSVFFFRDSGYLPEALCNFLTLMGYSMKGDREMYSIAECIEEFDPSRIGLSGAFFDLQKLDWLNQQHLIREIPEDQLWSRMQQWLFNDAFMQRLMPLIHTRIKTFGDFMSLCSFFFVNQLPWTEELLVPKNGSKELTANILQLVLWELDRRQDWSAPAMEAVSHQIAQWLGVHHKKMIMPILFGTICGQRQGPPLFRSFELLGKDRARARLLGAIEFCGGLTTKQRTTLERCWRDNNFQSLATSE